MTTPTFANSGSIQPAQGGEVACCSITGGPFAAVDAYVSGGGGAQLEMRLYATVGTLRTLVATAPYSGPPVGAAGQGSVLEWTVIDQPKATNPVVAGGTQYDLVAFGSTGAGAPIFCTLAGTNGYDTPVSASATVAAPSNFGSTTVATNVGCAQLADVGVDQAGVQACAFDVLVSCGAGSVEALVGTGTIGGTDGKADVIRQLPLPVGTQYRLAVRNTDGGQGVGNVTASLATYVQIVQGSISGLTPGPQITSLRSVVPTAPTQVVWASTGYVDFVADCGADPTGVVAADAAFVRAFALIKAISASQPEVETSCELFFPPGKYRITVGANQWNLLGFASHLKWRGIKGASILLFDNVSSGSFWLDIFNCQTIELEGITFVGTGMLGAVIDAAGLIQFNPQSQTYIHDCAVYNLVCSSQFSFQGLISTLTNVEIHDCAALGGGFFGVNVGILTFSTNLVSLRNVAFEDNGTLNGDAFPLRTTQCLAAIYCLGPANTILLDNCRIDEDVQRNLVLDGSGGNPIQYVRITGGFMNSPNAGFAPIASIDANNVRMMEVDANQSNTVGFAGPQILLTNCGRIVMKRQQKAANQTFAIQADAATRYVEIVDPQNFGATLVNINPAVTLIWKDFGTDTEVTGTVKDTDVGVAIGNVLKLVTVGAIVGYHPIATVDNPSLGTAVSLDAFGGGSTQAIRVAYPGQRVTMLSDGSNAIAIGDQVTNVGALANGQVTKAVAGSANLGTAMTAAAAGGGAVLFDVWFQPTH